MPTLADLRQRFPTATIPSDRTVASDETLISDTRSQLTPTEVVERKLGVALRRDEARRGTEPRPPRAK